MNPYRLVFGWFLPGALMLTMCLVLSLQIQIFIQKQMDIVNEINPSECLFG